MIGVTVRSLAVSILALASVPASAITVEEVIAKHIEARGGREGWDAVRSMRATGQFTAFSKVAPFTLVRERDDHYHLDHTLNGKKVVVGHDGEIAWWENLWFQAGAKPLSGADLAQYTREFDFVNHCSKSPPRVMR